MSFRFLTVYKPKWLFHWSGMIQSIFFLVTLHCSLVKEVLVSLLVANTVFCTVRVLLFNQLTREDNALSQSLVIGAVVYCIYTGHSVCHSLQEVWFS